MVTDQIVELLRKREPLFHNREITNNIETVIREIKKDYWEVGASGQKYDYDFVLSSLGARYRISKIDDMVLENWEVSEFNVTYLAQDTYLVLMF